MKNYLIILGLLTKRINKLPLKEKSILPNVWKGKNDEKISCTEKIKILNENILEINQIIDDAIEDAVLMGADPDQVKEVIIKATKEKTDIKY